jgi:hypothetical protein
MPRVMGIPVLPLGIPLNLSTYLLTTTTILKKTMPAKSLRTLFFHPVKRELTCYAGSSSINVITRRRRKQVPTTLLMIFFSLRQREKKVDGKTTDTLQGEYSLLLHMWIVFIDSVTGIRRHHDDDDDVEAQAQIDKQKLHYARNEFRSCNTQLDVQIDMPKPKRSAAHIKTSATTASARKRRRTKFNRDNLLGRDSYTSSIGIPMTQFSSSYRENSSTSLSQEARRERGLETGPTLLTGNVFEDSRRNVGAPNFPTSSAKQASRAVKEMVASFLEEPGRTAEDAASAEADQRLMDKHLGKYAHRPTHHVGEAGGWDIAGLNCSLTNVQMIGVGWMRWRETSAGEPLGGLLADAMGLGKTVQMLANIIDGRLTRKQVEDGLQKTTLVIVPASIQQQWFEEIGAHCNPRYIKKVMKWNPNLATTTNKPLTILKQHDIM